jgi:hypothetical protein
MNHINPEFKIYAIPFNSPEGTQIEFPQELIASVTSVRSITGDGAIKINLNNFAKTTVNKKKIKEIFHDQSMIALCVRRHSKEEFRKLNLCYCNGISVSMDSMGRLDWSLEFPTLERKLQSMEMFFDVQTEKQEQIAAGRPKNSATFGSGFSSVKSTVGDTITFKNLLIGMWNNIIVKLAGVDGFGIPGNWTYNGREFIRNYNQNKPDDNAVISCYFGNGYMDNLVSKIGIFSQTGFGSGPKFWDSFTSLATSPLFECFIDTLELGRDEAEPLLEDPYTYLVNERSLAALVFRKTPFTEYFTIDGQWTDDDTVYNDIEHYRNISFTENTNDIYAGVHVGITEIARSTGNGLIMPVKWSSALKKRYGYRVMKIALDGMTETPEEEGDLSSAATQREAVKKIQTLLFNIFCPEIEGEYLKNISVNMERQFDFHRVGQAYNWQEHELSEYYGEKGYLFSVTDTFDPRGSARSSLQFKWTENREALIPKV